MKFILRMTKCYQDGSMEKRKNDFRAMKGIMFTESKMSSTMKVHYPNILKRGFLATCSVSRVNIRNFLSINQVMIEKPASQKLKHVDLQRN